MARRYEILDDMGNSIHVKDEMCMNIVGESVE